jgi:hypothetical protein
MQRTNLGGAGSLAVLLIYEPGLPDGQPVPLARVQVPELTREAARIAIGDANRRAKRLATADEVVANLARTEARTLTATLQALLV